jgi:hypothetical protein
MIFEELNNNYMMAWLFNNLASHYRRKGFLDQALENVKKSLELHAERGVLAGKIATYNNLIGILIMKGNIDQAKDVLKDLEQLTNKINTKVEKQAYNYNKALILKNSSRALDRGKAEELLKQILEDENLGYSNTLDPLLELCDLLLFDLQLTNNQEVLEELKTYISKLYIMAEKSYSHELLAETHLLQAKLSLITFELDNAQQLLNKGQEIAEKYNLNLLAKKISNEHDELLKRLDAWERLKETNAPLEERLKQSRLNEQMETMIQKRLGEEPENKDEDEVPVFLLIISEGGRPIFSHSFAELSLEDHLFGGFFTAVNSFITEKFSEGLDRASFGEHTLLMNSIPPFFACYVYKGQSYYAQKRMKSFVTELERNEEMWDNFNSYYQNNQELQLNDIPLLRNLISKIFMKKNT